MSTWSQVFDDDRALDVARRRARGLLVGFALVSGAVVAAAPVATFALEASPAGVALVCGALLTLGAVVVVVRLGRENRRVWRVELSVRRVVGHDAAGRRVALAWAKVDRVDVTGAGLVVTGRDEAGHRVRLPIDAAMPAYTALAHRAVEYAEAHGRVICVDGCPIGRLDLVALFPALCETAA